MAYHANCPLTVKFDMSHGLQSIADTNLYRTWLHCSLDLHNVNLRNCGILTKVTDCTIMRDPHQQQQLGQAATSQTTKRPGQQRQQPHSHHNNLYSNIPGPYQTTYRPRISATPTQHMTRRHSPPHQVTNPNANRNDENPKNPNHQPQTPHPRRPIQRSRTSILIMLVSQVSILATFWSKNGHICHQKWFITPGLVYINQGCQILEFDMSHGIFTSILIMLVS